MNKRALSARIRSLDPRRQPAYSLALGCAALTTALGVVYGAYMLVLLLGGNLSFPPSQAVQLFGGITSIVGAPLLLILFVALHHVVTDDKKVFSSLGVVFCALFAVCVCINRFVQLSIVRLSILEGNAQGLERFLPYDGRSAMFALEMLGWGGFLSLALLFLAFALGKGALLRAARWSFFAYAALGLLSAVAFALGSPLAAVGFGAWGLILYVGTAFLALSLLRRERGWQVNLELN